MADINQLIKFAKTPENTLKIDWTIIENRLEFTLHENVKDFFSRIVCDKSQEFACCMYLDPKDLIKPSGNDMFDSYLRRNGNTNDMDRFGNDVHYTLNILSSEDMLNSYNTIYYAFNSFRLKNCNIGKRAIITRLDRRCNTTWFFINSDTGKYEWASFRNYETAFEDTPHGLVADNFNEFINKLIKMWKTG